MTAVHADATVSSFFNPHYIFNVFLNKRCLYASTAAAAASERPARLLGQVMTKNGAIIPEREEREGTSELS